MAEQQQQQQQQKQPGFTTPNESAIYHEVSPRKILGLRIFNGFVLFFILLSFLICLVRGQVNKIDSSPDYILATNIIISSLVAGMVSWWYRTGVLGVEKYWFVILVGCVMIFQCLTTDIYVFHKQVHILPTPTPAPTTTVVTSSYTMANITNGTTIPSTPLLHV